MNRRIGISTVVRDLRNGRRRNLARALRGLNGCPLGGWPQTEQAMRWIIDELPRRSERIFSVDDLLAAAMTVDHADRYRYQLDTKEVQS